MLFRTAHHSFIKPAYDSNNYTKRSPVRFELDIIDVKLTKKYTSKPYPASRTPITGVRFFVSLENL